MKKRSILHALMGMTLAGAMIFSCTSEDINSNEGNSEAINALVSTEQKVDFKISYDVPDGYRVTFDVYAENPFVITTDGFGKKPGVSPILSAMTDEKGNYHISRVISGGVEEVFVVSNSAGVPALLHGTIQGKTVEPTEVEMTSLLEEEPSAGSRAAFQGTFLGGWNFWGRPDNIDKTRTFNVTQAEMRAISKALPEWRKVKEEFTTADFVLVEKEAEVWVGLLSEKSLFNNVLGYFCYTDGMSKEDISEVVVFPRANISLLKSTGLHAGEYVKLKYLNPVTKKLENKFPAGTRIGWIMHRSGFQCLTSKVNNGTYQFYSYNEWNPEKSKKNHTAMFTTSKGNLIVGFEDLCNESLLVDSDCNDIVFHVASYPHDAIQAKIEIPDSEEDVVEEEVDFIQPLNGIIDVPSVDALANDILVASKSNLAVEDGKVVGVKDVLYLANTNAMNSLVTRTYTQSDMERKVVVRTTVKFARAEAPEGEKKGRTVVRTTVKNTSWEVEEEASRAVFCYEGDDVTELILATIEHYRPQLAEGKCIKLEIIMEFEPVEYEEFINNIDVPPYSPFIEHVN
jgi:hypothetical protein